jgi:hypothetical protein
VTDRAGVKVKAVVLDSPEHPRKAWPTLAGPGHTLLAQRYIPGDESAIESYHVYVDHTGDIAADFTGAKLHTWPLERGFTTACAITDRRGRPVRWVHPRDFLAARAAGQPLTRWLWFVAGARAKAFWSWRDPMPALRAALSRLR